MVPESNWVVAVMGLRKKCVHPVYLALPLLLGFFILSLPLAFGCAASANLGGVDCDTCRHRRALLLRAPRSMQTLTPLETGSSICSPRPCLCLSGAPRLFLPIAAAVSLGHRLLG